MADSLAHRGPDDAGTWVDAHGGVAFGHRRLSVIDLSAAGHQPMFSASNRYVIAFNGEIYNHLEIRDELEDLDAAPAWRGHSDTETLLAGCDHWALGEILQRAVGMFAFALWDRQERTLALARDRLGEKPLYYGWQGDTFMFGSELKSLKVHPDFEGEIDRAVLALYLRHGYVPSPYSIYKGIWKLPPGTYLTLSGRARAGELSAPNEYWSLREVTERGRAEPFEGDEDEALSELERLLQRAVSFQRVADVPLGAFLSGGIDSSTIVALMQEQSSRPVKTFTIGFKESEYQEADYARSVADHLATDHTELYLTAREAMDTIPKLPQLYDEPFGDSSAIPTYLVSQLARREVTVSLSGDGGDELFGGYTRYRRTSDIWRLARKIPRRAGGLLSQCLRSVPMSRRVSSLGSKMDRLAEYLSAETAEQCYQAQTSHCFDESDLVLGSSEIERTRQDSGTLPSNVYDLMMYTDILSYLPDDILVKVDRASMGVSLEARVPMLDHRVVEFAWCLPLHMKIRGGEGKWLLKRLLHKYVPPALFERPKMGFGVPVAEWVKGPLRDWAESLLAETRLKQDGFLNASMVRERWRTELRAGASGSDHIWHLLAFQAWLEEATGR